MAPAPRIPPERLRGPSGCLHSCGARALYEFLKEIEAGAPLAPTLETYCDRVAPFADLITAFDGHDLPPARLVRGRGR
jgi:hypothetical protein